MRLAGFLLAVVLLLPSPSRAQNVTVTIDATAATSVLAAVRDRTLTVERALAIARLPGNQGLIRKAKSYGRTASDALFAQALVAAAHRDAGFVDIARFDFANVRDHAAQTERALTALNDPSLRLLDTARARIATFTPATLRGEVTGYLVVGGTSGGFAFGEPAFYLNLDRFPSATLAATIMQHELYHAVQALARSTPTAAQALCLAAILHAEDVATFFGSLLAEGTASYVGDVLRLPDSGADEPVTRERARFARNVGLVSRSITQLELSVHGLVTGAAVSPDEVYALGFYGDEVMYPLGYVMTRAIVQEEGERAVGELIGSRGALFVARYLKLNGYGKSAAMPALKPATVRWAHLLSGCFAAG